ncbi:hypothetical protein H4R18_005334 [Coemansia javaensis]|uniref:AA9 family lytic polysaccharide monooxygenase n=1 Tax=Coemansia javaensis TaxID=2761396 RepID=A0A9W8H9G9_9FUNG|nr:hypothetical protein H4R18_005334 [Coemansia javaensis]
MACYLLKQLAAWAVLAGGAWAHTHIHNPYIDGQLVDNGKCVRPYMDGFYNPVRGVTGDNILCRSASPGPENTETCNIKAGTNVTIEFHESMDHVSIPIHPTHKGPCIMWISPLAANGAGNVWVKIAEQGYNPETKTWCIDDVNSSGGKWNATIPAELEDGEYLLRGEIIALHQARTPGMVEFYPNCVHLRVTGGGGQPLPPGVSIPSVYKADDPGILFDIYTPYRSYPIPGPPVFKFGTATVPGNGTTTDKVAAGGPPTNTATTDTTPTTSTSDPSSSGGNSNSNPGGSGGNRNGSHRVCSGKKRRRRRKREAARHGEF